MPVSPSAKPSLSWLRFSACVLGPGLMKLLSHLLFRAVTEDSYTDMSAGPSCLSTRGADLSIFMSGGFISSL